MTSPAEARWTVVSSPLGNVRIIARGEAISALDFEPFRTDPSGRPLGARCDDDDLLSNAREQVREYFLKTRWSFDLPLQPRGSDFQRAVWAELLKIGYGDTVSYGEIARALGRTNAASRAVGLANGSNPIAIIIPCHRVIGADGSLTGYAGGLARKQTLLELEQDALF